MYNECYYIKVNPTSMNEHILFAAYTFQWAYSINLGQNYINIRTLGIL